MTTATRADFARLMNVNRSTVIDAQIRAATRDGLPTFYASENGRTVGVPLPEPRRVFSLAEIVIEHPPEKKSHAPRR